jgi:hypothetical protein
MKDMYTASDGASDFFDESPAFDGEQKQRPRETATPSNLTNYRWHHALPNSGEERDLIRASKAGDERANNQLAKNYHRLVLALAKRFHGPSRGELIAAGELGFAKALAAYDLTANTAFRPYYEVRNAIRAAAKEWRKRGQAGETRADRWVYNHRDARPSEVVEKVGCSIQDARAAVQRADGYWHGHEHYDTAEHGNYDYEGGGERPLVVVDVPSEDVHASAVVSNSDWDAIVAYRARRQAPEVEGNLVQLRFDPLKPVGRERYSADQAAAHRVAHAGTMLSGLRGRVDSIVEWYAAETDRRAARRLKQIGRRAYALELVEKDRARIAARADPQNYLYPWVAHNAPQLGRPIAKAA